MDQDVLIRVQEKEREEKTITLIYCHLIGKDKQESYNKVKSQTCFVWLLTFYYNLRETRTRPNAYLKNEKTTKGSMNLKRLKAGWDENYLSQLLRDNNF